MHTDRMWAPEVSTSTVGNDLLAAGPGTRVALVKKYKSLVQIFNSVVRVSIGASNGMLSCSGGYGRF